MMATPELQDEGHSNEAAPQEDASNEDLYESDEFRMYCYKVLPCAKRASHEWTSCPFSHPNEKARRRDPRIYKYLAIPCPDTKEGKTCPRGDDCPNCHSLFEYWLHPSRYRTQLCRNNDGSHCKRQICFFAHSIEELRVPDHSHLNIPEELLQRQQSADKDADSKAGDSQDGSSLAGEEHSTTTSSSCSGKEDKAGSSSSKRRASKGNSSNGRAGAGGKQCGSPTAAAAATASNGGLMTTTAGMLPSNLELPPSPCGPMTPMLPGPYVSALAAGYGGSSWSANSGAYLPRSASLDQHVYDSMSCFSAPGTPASALRRGSFDPLAMRGSLELASGRTSVDLPPSGRSSVHRASFDLAPAGAPSAGGAANGMFCDSMIGDPEVPDPCYSPRTAAMQRLKQQQVLAMQQEQLEAAVGAALNYEQQMLQLHLHQHQQQQQAAWLAGRAAGMGEYGAGGSPPLSPAPSSVVGSRSSMTADELFSAYSPAASSASSGACWAPHSGGLPRTLSGPAVYGGKPGGLPPSHPAFRYSSLDAPHIAAAAAAASAADVASQVQMAALQRAASIGSGPQYSVAAPVPPPQQQQQRRPGEQQQQIRLQDVAELVDSVNRGDLGECGNQVLTGVISLLMQQLQHQQLVA